MDIKLILVIICVVILNSSLLAALFWYFFGRKGSVLKITDDKTFADTKKPNPTTEKGRFKLLIFLSAIILALGIVYFFSFRHNAKNDFLVPANPASSQEVKKTDFYHNPQAVHPRGLNLVFFADDYNSWDEFDNDITDLMIGIGQIEPWKTYANYNIYKINPGMETQLCQVKTENERKPVLRCDAKINDYLGKLQLENFRLIVLSRQDFQSWANVTRLENSGIFFSLKDKLDESNSLAISYLFAHLLGHSFGLKDEEKFVIAKADGAPHTPDGPNCAPDEETAKEWWGDLAKKYPNRVGYFKTCAGSDNFIRPTESSLMNFGNLEKFIPDYGPVSTEYLQKILNYCFSEKKITQNQDTDFFERYPEFKKCLD
ncbi:MAG: hypothetical protein NTY33_01330 [Candidatus Moranbacteria bacterium]|nr:hypothetical protein [Candidatus Moranbacteria bacterium]